MYSSNLGHSQSKLDNTLYIFSDQMRMRPLKSNDFSLQRNSDNQGLVDFTVSLVYCILFLIDVQVGVFFMSNFEELQITEILQV